jgi:hypothetical protein
VSDRKLYTPAAILLAGAFVGAGLFLGLRSRPVEYPASPLDAQGAAEHARTPRRPPPSQALAATPPVQVAEQVKRVLDSQRAALVNKCWEPAIKTRPTPAEIKYVFDFTFAADGQQIARGVRADRATSRAEVTACVLAALTPVTIPPPGATTRVDVAFSLP